MSGVMEEAVVRLHSCRETHPSKPARMVCESWTDNKRQLSRTCKADNRLERLKADIVGYYATDPT